MKLPRVFDQLLVRPQPEAGESPWGFRLRLAHANGLSQPAWLLDSGERRPSGLARLCAACLAGPELHWRAVWSSSKDAWCAEHRIWLVDQCPSCKRRLSWGQVRFQGCSCGHSWGDCKTDRVDASIWMTVTTGVAPESVLRLLGALSLHGPSRKPGKKIVRSSVAEVRQQCEAGQTVLNDWPANFFTLLKRWRVPPAGPGRVQLLREALPGLDEVPSLVAEPAWRERITTAIDSFCASTVGGPAPIIGRNAVLSSGPSTLKEISARLGRKVESIAKAIDASGAGLGAVRVTAAGRRRRVVGDAALAKLKEALNEPIALKAAARQLRLPVSRLSALVDAGLLSLPNGSLLKAELAALVRSLPACVAKSPVRPGSSLTLRKALRDWVHLDDTAALFQSIREGYVAVHRTRDREALGTWHVPLEALRSWSSSRRPRPQALLTLREVGAGLGLKDDVVRDLVRKGLLPARRGALAHHASWVVRASDLDAFRRNYIALARLAAEAGVRLRDGFDWAQSKGLKVVCGPRVDGSRQYFVQV